MFYPPAAINLTIWVDRLRVRSMSKGVRVEGETRRRKVTGPWVPCFFAPRGAQEAQGQDKTTLIDQRDVTCRLYDEDGGAVIINEADEVEVQFGPSRTPGGIWEVKTTMVPRNGRGQDLLIYLSLLQRQER
jgi:hypothetical protein